MRPACVNCKTARVACTGANPCVRCESHGIQCEQKKTPNATVACLPCRKMKLRCVKEDSSCTRCRASGKETKCVFQKQGIHGHPTESPEAESSKKSKISPGPGDSDTKDAVPNSKDVPLRYGWFITISDRDQLEGYFRRALDALAPHFHQMSNNANQIITGIWLQKPSLCPD